MTQIDPALGTYAPLFAPLNIGPMKLKSRVMMSPHFSAIGNLWGSEADAKRSLAYLKERAEAGVSWITITGRIGNHFIPGFEPSGLSAEVLGFFRLPYYAERVAMLTEAMDALDTRVIMQMTLLGGYPHAPSDIVSAPIGNAYPHVMTAEDIDWLVSEYRHSAKLAAPTGLAGIELHFNHDDLIEQFMSPLTNLRTDEYGGSFDNRMRLARRIVAAIREEMPGRVLGVRLNAFEELEGGYGPEDAVQIAQAFEAMGVDYISIVAGSHWGNPSYIQQQQFQAGQWSHFAGQVKAALTIPVVYTGLVDHPDVALSILTRGEADVVGIARAHIADGQFLAKARAGKVDLIRPCIAANDCINRRYVDGLPFGCAVNPHTAKEIDGPMPKAHTPRDLVVVGAGPAGMELAALAAEAGHKVRLWEAADQLGGQLRLATLAPDYDRLSRYLDWQEARLHRAGVEITTGKRATLEDLMTPEVVALATGATGRRPRIIGAARGVEARDILTGKVRLGQNVLLVAEEDHMQPLALATRLAADGHQVTMVYGTNTPAQLLGRYAIGGWIGKLDGLGVKIRVMEQVKAITDAGVEVMNVYSKRREILTGFDSVAFACGGVADSALYDALHAKRGDVHILGDAYAPRRMVFATRQAHALALLLSQEVTK